MTAAGVTGAMQCAASSPGVFLVRSKDAGRYSPDARPLVHADIPTRPPATAYRSMPANTGRALREEHSPL